MSSKRERLGSLIGPFVQKLLADLGPLVESYLIALLSGVVAKSSAIPTAAGGGDGAVPGIGSPITPVEAQKLSGALRHATLQGFSEHVAQQFNQLLMQHGASAFSEGSVTGGKERPDLHSA